LKVLGAAAGLLALITCANLAGLFAARNVARAREIAMRLAVGAGRARIVRMLLAEGIVVAAAAAVLGCALAGWMAQLMAAIGPARRIQLATDWRVIAFAAAAGAVTVLLFALLPAMRALPVDLIAPLKNGAPGSGRRGSRVRRLLLAAQMAACFVLLTAAGLLVRDVARTLSADPGYETHKLAMGSIDLTLNRIAEEKGLAIYRELIRGLPSIPGVVSATLASSVPPEEYPGRVSIFHPGETPSPEMLMAREFQLGLRVDINRVGPRYFETLGIRLLQGRDFSLRDDAGEPLVAIVTPALAARMWPGENPIGKRLSAPEWGGPPRPPIEVIGLAVDTRSHSLAGAPVAVMYLPVLQNYDGRTRLVVRTASEPAGAIAGIEQTLHGVNPELALYRPETMGDHVAQSVWAQRMAMEWIAAFALMALVLSAIGLYGAMAQLVSQRTREVGIRMALGATPEAVSRMVVMQGMWVGVTGAAAGVPSALLVTGMLRQWLSQVGPRDPLSYVAAALVLWTVLLAACWIPARRAARVDPVESLRGE
jgi:predicted permease